MLSLVAAGVYELPQQPHEGEKQHEEQHVEGGLHVVQGDGGNRLRLLTGYSTVIYVHKDIKVRLPLQTGFTT